MAAMRKRKATAVTPAAAKRQHRCVTRATPEAGPGSFTSVVSTYGIDYEIGWGWAERILEGCFAESIEAQDGTIPIFYTHDWPGGPIGVSDDIEETDKLTVRGHLYLGMAERIDVLYQAMVDGALREWSIGFWPETITTDKDEPMVDQIAKGDLAEASVCVRGANPETGTEELLARRGAVGWVDGDHTEQRKEVARLRKMFGNLPDLSRRRGQPSKRAYSPEPYSADDDEPVVCPACGLSNDVDATFCDQCGAKLAGETVTIDDYEPQPYAEDDDEPVVCPNCDKNNDLDASFCDQCGFELAGAEGVVVETASLDSRRRTSGHTHQHKHGAAVHSHEHTHGAGNYDHNESDLEVTHDHDHADDVTAAARSARLMATGWGRDELTKIRGTA